MSRIMQAWERVLNNAVAQDFDTQQDAIFQIGLVLERHHQPNMDAGHLYEDNLPRELQRLTLNEKRQQDAVHYLASMAAQHPGKADGFIYAMGRARPALMIDALLALIAAQDTRMNDAAAYQSVQALLNCLKNPDDTVRAALEQSDPTDTLEAWAERDDDELVAATERALARLDDLFDEIDK
ncbi:MAG: hypothetical protein ACPG7F_02935 [Aggregatilineales bacterium]